MLIVLGTIGAKFESLVGIFCGTVLCAGKVGVVGTGHSIVEYLVVATFETIGSGGATAVTALGIAGETFTLLLVRIEILEAFIRANVTVLVANALVADMCVESVARATFASRVAFTAEDLSE